MAQINYVNQIVYTGAGPLDGKVTPVNTYNDLLKIPRAQRFPLMTVMVIDEGVEYWLQDGLTNSSWKIKNPVNIMSGDDLE